MAEVFRPGAAAEVSKNSYPSAKSSSISVTSKKPETVRVFWGKETTHWAAAVKSVPKTAVPLAAEMVISRSSVSGVTPDAKPTSYASWAAPAASSKNRGVREKNRVSSLSVMTMSAAFTAYPVRPLFVPGGMEPVAGPGEAAVSRPMMRTRSSPSANASSTTVKLKEPDALVALAGMVMLNFATAA